MPRLLPARLAAQIQRRVGDYATPVSITIYNKYIVAGTETWQRTVLVADLWSNRNASNVLASGGNLAVDTASIIISSKRNANYRGPTAWRALSSKTGYWTLQKGDIVVKGSVSDTVGGSFTPTDLKAKYDDVLNITSVDPLDLGVSDMLQWKVGAK